MNYIKPKLLILSLIMMLIPSIPIKATIESDPTALAKNKLIVIDSKENNPLPDRFRIITSLNISGSAEFTPSQLPNMLTQINSKSITIVDLRQESHGYINEFPISFYSLYELLNNGFNSAESLQEDITELSSIADNSNTILYNRSSLPYKTITVTSKFTEKDLCTNNKVNYMRFAVRDGGIPAPNIVDDFVTFIKNKSDNNHLHFHCLHGEGRTTTFMALYQIMNNQSNLTLNQILEQQLSVGGIVLTTDAARDEFLEAFYQYVQSNKGSNYNLSYSKWLSHLS